MRHQKIRGGDRVRRAMGFTRLRAIELRGEGLTFDEIAQRLNSQGFLDGRKRWYAGSVRQLINKK